MHSSINIYFILLCILLNREFNEIHKYIGKRIIYSL
jgi:hypothetical protein